MPLPPGTRLGPYEVIAFSKAGGMGEVYLATDTRLDRMVAVKVLPTMFAGDPERRRRFELEARAVARLTHPCICALFDVGHEDGHAFLVMEHLEGETLGERLRLGPLPMKQVLRYGIEIAEALAAAHKQGIVHRDLKPGNVMLTRSGAKLLDFGVAKMRAAVATEDHLHLVGAATEEEPGVAGRFGTVQYMSPEQIEGRPLDGRSDIFALGSMLYEMATGKPAFPGDTHAEVMTRILRSEPAPLLGNVPDATATLDRVVRTCLAKDPEERWHSAHDVAAELRWIAEGEGPAARRPPQATGRLPMRFRSAVALAALLATLGGVGWLLGRRLSVAPASDRRVRFDIRPEPGSRLLPDRPALSPDGQTLVFTASGADGHSWLWRRALAEPESRPLARSNGSALPFWSPDGRFVAFETGDKLMKVPAAGGPAQQLATTAGFYGGTWSRAGMILFCPGIKSGLFLVSGEGGPTTPATTPDLDRLETAHLYPHFLPDGKRFVFLVLSPRKDVRGIYLGELGSRLKTRLTEAFSAPSSTPEGRLLYGVAGRVLEQDLNLEAERLDGAARPVAEDLYAWGGGVGHRAFSCENGVLAWRRGGVHRTRLAWFDRQGRPLEEAAPPNDYQDFALSPDGQRIVASVIDESGLSDLWLIDLERTIFSRLTTDASDSFRPVFFADGRRIAFTSLRGGTYDVFTQDIASVDAARPLVRTEADEFPQDVSPDGQSLIFSSYEAQGGGDLFSVAVSEKASYVPLVVSRWHENGARFSPSGNHFAYASWESGLQEIYVKPFPQGAERSMLSSGGGASPFWRRDGRELFYLSPDGMLMSVEVHAQGRAVAAGKPRALFMTATPGREAGTSEQGVAGLSPDGQQFLLKVPVDDAGSERIALEIRGPRR